MTMENQDGLPATKGDLKAYATKDDLENFGAKLGVKIGAEIAETIRTELRTELNKAIRPIHSMNRRMARRIIIVEAGLRDVRETMATRKDIDRVMNAIDDFAGKSLGYSRAMTLHGESLTETRVELKDHERRIKKLEDGVGA